MSNAGGSVRPMGVKDYRKAGMLVVEWEDGSISTLPHRLLRERCRCAACTQAARSAAVAVPAAVSIVEIRPVSDQGLNLVFSDGHGRGIYPWAYLRALGDDWEALPAFVPQATMAPTGGALLPQVGASMRGGG